MQAEIVSKLYDMQQDAFIYQQIYEHRQKHILQIRLHHESFLLLTLSPANPMF